MTSKYGVFSEPGHLGEPYKHTMGMDDREKGLNFKATVARQGKLNDACFDKFKPLLENDKYVETTKQQQRDRAENSKHLVGGPFRAASPMKKSTGLGDFYGTLSGKIPYEAQHIEAKLKKGDVPEKPRNFYTSPPKKGTYGMNKTTLSERGGPKGVASEYEYHADPQDQLKARQREEHFKDIKSRVTELPFKPNNPPKRGHYGQPNVTISKGIPGKEVAEEFKYECEGQLPRMKSASEITTPFKPSNPPKSGYNGCMNRFPEYYADPEEPKMMSVRERKKAESARLAAIGPWRPNMSSKTDMTRSIVRMNI